MIVEDSVDMEQVGLEISRVTVNTHHSLLNLDDDDEENDETSFAVLDEDELCLTVSSIHDDFTPVKLETSPCVITTRKSTRASKHPASSLIEEISEKFADSFCYSQIHKEDDKSTKVTGEDHADDLLWEGYRSLVASDILELLTCVSVPSDKEVSFIWSEKASKLFCVRPAENSNSAAPAHRGPRRPLRLMLQARAERIRQLRLEPSGALSPDEDADCDIRRTQSLDCDWVPRRELPSKELQSRIGFGLEPIPQLEEIDLGYESDPGEVFEDPGYVRREPETVESLDTSDVKELVQDSLNITWKLIWHQVDQKSTPIEVWIERGTLLPAQSVTLEPRLMWREARQPMLASSRKLNESTQRPHSIRLLSLCRLLPGEMSNLENWPVLARPSRCLVLKVAENGATSTIDYVMEATSTAARNEVLCRWKHVVARFAMLAVLEDAQLIQREFFRLIPNSQMLIPEYDALSGVIGKPKLVHAGASVE